MGININNKIVKISFPALPPKAMLKASQINEEIFEKTK
jgi:hypothetical protein